MSAAVSSIWRFFDRHEISFKKNRARQQWKERQPLLDPSRLVDGLRQDGIIAPFVIDQPMNGDIFLAYLETATSSRASPPAIPSSSTISRRTR